MPLTQKRLIALERQGQAIADVELTDAEQAELEAYRTVDRQLRKLSAARQRAADDLKAAVLAAREQLGAEVMSDVYLAKVAGVDRGTIRRWLGKARTR